MKISLINYPDEYSWLQCKQRAIITMGKKKVVTPPNADWKHKMLEARHSPIRWLRYSFYIEDLPYWVSNELCRHHEGIEKYIRSQRNDRQSDYDRNAARQDAPVNAIIDFNAEGLMNFCNKRMCKKASKEMQNIAKEFAALVFEKTPEMIGLLAPNCIYHGGQCHEIESCRGTN